MFCEELRGNENTGLVDYFRASNLWKKVAVTALPAVNALLREAGGVGTFPSVSLVMKLLQRVIQFTPWPYLHHKTISTISLTKQQGDEEGDCNACNFQSVVPLLHK